MARRFSVETVFSAIDKMSLPLQRMEGRVGRFSRRAKRGMMGIARVTDKLVFGMAGMVKRVGQIGTALSLGGGIAMTFMNKASAQSEVLANSVGVSVKTVDALARAIKPAGFEFDNVIDLIEEMNNKLGESGTIEEMAAVKDTMKVLGLEFANIKKLKPEDQFKVIVDAALQMKNIQDAAFALDSLFSGEGNKILGVLRQAGPNVAKILEAQEKLNFKTDEGRRGARMFTAQLNRLNAAFVTLASQISGRLGGGLAGVMQRIGDVIENNKVQINNFVEMVGQEMAPAIKKTEDFFKNLSNDDVKKGLKLFSDTFKNVYYYAIDIKNAVSDMMIIFKPLTAIGRSIGRGIENSKPKPVGIDAHGKVIMKSINQQRLDEASRKASVVAKKDPIVRLLQWMGVGPQQQSSTPPPSEQSTTTRQETVNRQEVTLRLPPGMSAYSDAPTAGIQFIQSGR